MKQKYYTYIWIAGIFIILIIIYFFFLENRAIVNTGDNVKKITNSMIKKEKKTYKNYIIKDKNGTIYTIKVEKKLKDQCFSINTGYYILISNNIIEKTFKIPSNIYECIKKNVKFKKVISSKRKDIVIDNKGILHILNSNINLNIIGYKIYGHK